MRMMVQSTESVWQLIAKSTECGCLSTGIAENQSHVNTRGRCSNCYQAHVLVRCHRMCWQSLSILAIPLLKSWIRSERQGGVSQSKWLHNSTMCECEADASPMMKVDKVHSILYLYAEVCWRNAPSSPKISTHTALMLPRQHRAVSSLKVIDCFGCHAH